MAVLADSKLGYRLEEAEFVLGSSQLLAEMTAAGWLRPVIHRHKLTIFDRGDIARAWARILSGEEPPRLQRNGKHTSTNFGRKGHRKAPQVGPADAKAH